MNRIKNLFAEKKRHILSIYFTAGYPQLNSTVPILKYLQDYGADLVEIGIPFSDPIADGPTIQASNDQALENGMNLKLLFEQLRDIRKSVNIPIILMGYLNPILQYGIENFCRKCSETGIDGVILPDLPMQEYLDNYKEIFEKEELYNIFLITPQSPDERIKWIDQNSNGFIYMVSSASITGARTGINEEQEKYFNRIRKMELSNPLMIGFGISDQQSFNMAGNYASGAIIGSAFIKAISNNQNLKLAIKNFLEMVKGDDISPVKANQD